MMYLFLLFFISHTLYSQDQLEAIDVQNSHVSEDFTGLDALNAPVSIQSFESKTIQENRLKTMKDISILDASVTDSYSGSGYWDSLNIRGFNIDNRRNYFRNGLRINAQTVIPLENMESVEIIKGLGAFQTSGTSSAGSVNLKTKTAGEKRSLRVEATERGGYLAHLDFGRKVDKFKYRFNLLNEEIRSAFNNNDGSRNVLAGAFSYELSPTSMLEFELEWSERSQTSLAAQGFWGNSLPNPNRQLNLNNQSWAKPVEFESLFYSARYSKELPQDWFLTLSAGRQRSVTDDRMSYPFGCSRENSWTSFCQNGDFDVYDYRSENERRTTDSTRISLTKHFGGTVGQELSLNVRYSQMKEKAGFQAYNFVGEGNQAGRRLPSDSRRTDPTRNLRESDLEFFVVDQLKYKDWGLWLGGNFQVSSRKSILTDGSEKNAVYENFITPWVSLTKKISENVYYLSYSQGKESWVTPSKPTYQNPGKVLSQETTHQYELGIKNKNFSSAVFYMKRPRLFDDSQSFKRDGFYQQYGIEGAGQFKIHNTDHSFSLMYLQVKQFAEGVNGYYSPNIPDLTLRYLMTLSLRPFSVGVRGQYEAARFASYDNQKSIPDWIKWDIFVEKKWRNLKGKLYVDNVFQKNYWRESPIQYGHNYLYQGAGRRVGILAEWSF